MRAGRKPASVNREYVLNEVIVSACPQCGCTERSSYEQPQRIERQSPRDARLIEVIVLRRCRCLACGTFRCDRCVEVLRRPTLPIANRGTQKRQSTPL